MKQNKDPHFTIAMLGGSSAGKSALKRRFVHQRYSKIYIPIKFTPDIIQCTINQRPCTLIIRDEQRDRTLFNPAFHVTRYIEPYKGNDGAIICFDLTNKESFNDAKLALDCLRHHSKTHCILLAGTKSDLTAQRIISYEEATQFAKEENIEFIEVSAKNNVNVTHLFTTLAKKLLASHENASS